MTDRKVSTIDDYKREDGSIDWRAYDKAKIDEGRNCYRCISMILWGKGYRSLCSDCTKTDTDDVDSFTPVEQRGQSYRLIADAVESCRTALTPPETEGE